MNELTVRVDVPTLKKRILADFGEQVRDGEEFDKDFDRFLDDLLLKTNSVLSESFFINYGIKEIFVTDQDGKAE